MESELIGEQTRHGNSEELGRSRRELSATTMAAKRREKLLELFAEKEKHDRMIRTEKRKKKGFGFGFF